MSTIIFRSAVRVAAALIVLFSLHLMLRGHNMPGGGFIAGLMFSAAIVLEYLAFGIQGVKRFARSLHYIFGAGLAIVLVTGTASMAFGHAFLRSAWVTVTAGAYGPIQIASGLAFDFGVFCVVVGVTMTILTLLGEEESF